MSARYLDSTLLLCHIHPDAVFASTRVRLLQENVGDGTDRGRMQDGGRG